jgi:hypothetical protein
MSRGKDTQGAELNPEPDGNMVELISVAGGPSASQSESDSRATSPRARLPGFSNSHWTLQSTVECNRYQLAVEGRQGKRSAHKGA